MIYDKLILDTSNVFYRVAAFYLKNLTQEKTDELIKSNTIFNQYKSVIQNFLIQTSGKVCLLFDPLLSNGKESTRVQIKEGYKNTRDRKSPVNVLRIDVLEKLYSYYLMSNQNRIEVYHDFEYEADDFVEKLTENGKCLMITSDEDFCRYLEEGRVEMLKQGLSIKDTSIFTAKNFEEKYGFKPTISSVVFWKAIYGDKSDNVIGSFKDPSTKVIRTASDEMKRLIKELGENNVPMSEAKSQFFAGVGRFEELKKLLQLSNTDCSYENILNLTDSNFRVIESLLPRSSDIDIEKFKVRLAVKPTPKKKFSLGGLKSK